MLITNSNGRVITERQRCIDIKFAASIIHDLENHKYISSFDYDVKTGLLKIYLDFGKSFDVKEIYIYDTTVFDIVQIMAEIDNYR